MSTSTLSICNSLSELVLLRVTEALEKAGKTVNHIDERTIDLVNSLSASIVTQYKEDPTTAVALHKMQGYEFLIRRHIDGCLADNVVRHESTVPWYVGVLGDIQHDWSDDMALGGFAKHRVLTYDKTTYIPVTTELV